MKYNPKATLRMTLIIKLWVKCILHNISKIMNLLRNFHNTN